MITSRKFAPCGAEETLLEQCGCRRLVSSLHRLFPTREKSNRWFRSCAWTWGIEREQLDVLGRSRSTGNVRNGGSFGELR